MRSSRRSSQRRSDDTQACSKLSEDEREESMLTKLESVTLGPSHAWTLTDRHDKDKDQTVQHFLDEEGRKLGYDDLPLDGESKEESEDDMTSFLTDDPSSKSSIQSTFFPSDPPCMQAIPEYDDERVYGVRVCLTLCGAGSSGSCTISASLH